MVTPKNVPYLLKHVLSQWRGELEGLPSCHSGLPAKNLGKACSDKGKRRGQDLALSWLRQNCFVLLAAQPQIVSPY